MFFTNTPQEFGHEIRGIAVVDIRNGKFVRWADYWDGRHFGVSATESLRTPPAQFPADFGESRVGESAAPAMTRIVGELSSDFARDNSEQAAQLFAPNAVLEDLTLHTAIVGRQSIAAYLARALPSLPYGQGAQVRHVVGGAAGGGYEWTNARTGLMCVPVPLQVFPEAQLSYVESESIFRVSRLLETLLQEGFDSFLRRWSLDGGHAGVPARPDFDVGRQAGFVHEVLGVRDRPLVERRDAGCECVDEIVQLGIREGTVHVAEELGIGASDVVCAQ